MQSLCTVRKWKIWAFCFIWVMSSGCSLLLIDSKKKYGQECSSSAINYAVPVTGSLATLASGTLTMLMMADGFQGPKISGQLAAIGLTAMGVFSAIYGFTTIAECRAWKAAQMTRGARNINLSACGAPYPGFHPGMSFAPPPKVESRLKMIHPPGP